jgi:hypothetical protein
MNLTHFRSRAGISQNLGLMPYSEQFHKIRRLLHKELNSEAEKQYHPLHEKESRILVTRVLARPEKLSSLIRQ